MSTIIQKTHKDRYRKVFCDQEFYIYNQSLFKMWKTRFCNLTNVEKVQAWVVALSCLRRPEDWYGGKRLQTFLGDTLNYRHSLNLEQVFAGTPVKIPPKLSAQTNLIDFINVCKIKAVPEACNRSLSFIANNYYPLRISEIVPTPKELLQLQLSGSRIITLNEDCELWPTNYYSGRDFLGFIMHDLIHADHFFLDPEHRDGQLGFFRFIESILEDKMLNDLLFQDSFKTGFEYIISDMNSHPVHLFQTLHALLFTENKHDESSRACWENWVRKSPLTRAEIQPLLLVNSTFFNNEAACLIEILCIRLGKQFST